MIGQTTRRQHFGKTAAYEWGGTFQTQMKGANHTLPRGRLSISVQHACESRLVNVHSSVMQCSHTKARPWREGGLLQHAD